MEYASENPTVETATNQEVAELVERIQSGDAEALGNLYDRYSGRVYAFLLRAVGRELAEELLQDVFVGLWQKAWQYNPAKGSFHAWFFTLVRRRLYDALPRYYKHRNENSLSEPGQGKVLLELAETRPEPEEYILKLFRDEEVRKALQHLPPEQRQIILMTYFGGMSQRELAEKLNLPVSTIKGRARLGLQRLRQLLPERL